MQNTHLASKYYGRIPKKSQDRESLIMGIAIRSLSAFEDFYEGDS